MGEAEHTNLMGRTTGTVPHPIYFAWIQLIFLCWINNSFTSLVKTKPVKQEVTRTVILPPYGERSMVKVTFEVVPYFKLLV